MSYKTLSPNQMGRLAHDLQDFVSMVDMVNQAGAYIGKPTLGLVFAMSAADVLRTIASARTVDEKRRINHAIEESE